MGRAVVGGKGWAMAAGTAGVVRAAVGAVEGSPAGGEAVVRVSPDGTVEGGVVLLLRRGGGMPRREVDALRAEGDEFVELGWGRGAVALGCRASGPPGAQAGRRLWCAPKEQRISLHDEQREKGLLPWTA